MFQVCFLEKLQQIFLVCATCVLSRTCPTLIQVPFIATLTSLNNDDDGRQVDEFGRSPDNEIKAVTPTGNTSTTLNGT